MDQDDLPDLPSHIRDAILGGKVPSGGNQLNHYARRARTRYAAGREDPQNCAS